MERDEEIDKTFSWNDLTWPRLRNISDDHHSAESQTQSRASMSPSAGELSQTPDSKSSGGFANVFKTLTGSRPSKGTNPQSPAAGAQQINDGDNVQPVACLGPPNYEALYAQLKKDNPLPERIVAAEALRLTVADYPLSSVTSIFTEGRDLIRSNHPPEVRLAGFELLTACVQQHTASNPERLAYFRVLAAPLHAEDFHLQLASLVALSRNGRNLAGFPQDAIPLLIKWLQNTFKSTSSARRTAGRQNRSLKSKAPLDQEKNLGLLFAFIVDIIKFSASVFNDQTTNNLIDEILAICVVTSVTSDLKSCLTVIDTIVTYSHIPESKLVDVIKVLGSVHALVEDVHREAWRPISNLCRTHLGWKIVTILLDILRNAQVDTAVERQPIRDIRGALSVLEKLFAKDGKKGYPLVPFTHLMSALENAMVVEHTKVENDVLHLILSLFKSDKTIRSAANDVKDVDKDAQANVFGEDYTDVKKNIIEEDWSTMFQVVTKCSLRALGALDEHSMNRNRSQIGSPLANNESVEGTLFVSLTQLLHDIILKIESLLVKRINNSFLQRDDCIEFFISIHKYLPERCAKMVIDHYMTNRYCYPTDSQWKDHTTMLLEAFFTDRTQPTHIRLHALKVVTGVFEVIEMMDEHIDSDIVEVFITSIFDKVGEEKDIAVLQEVVAFAVFIADKADETLFEYIIHALRHSIASDRLQSPLGSPTGSRQGFMTTRSTSLNARNPPHTPSNVVTRGMVQIFMRSMDKSPLKASRVMSELLWVAKSHDCEMDARISALKMLFRLRADWANRIFLTPFTESDGLAVSLYRTPASLARKQATDEANQQLRSSRIEENGARILRATSSGSGHPQTRQPLRSSSGLTRTLQKNHQMWMTPDPDALPEPTSGKVSSTMVSVTQFERPNGSQTDGDNISLIDSEKATGGAVDGHESDRKGQNDLVNDPDRSLNTSPDSQQTENPSYNVVDSDGVAEAVEDDLTPDPRTPLDISRLLETIVSLIEHGCDWEVYSYILVHLPYQLTNQALFKAAIPQIRSLRQVICEQIKNNSFQDPPLSSGLRKADVAICLFQNMNMIMSYHQYFSKLDQEEIVRTFVQGVGERTSKCCIHALSICCHEMPAATSKSLVHVLQKMSQIITQSHVAIHILEFLACLARLPALYVNFREEEYRIVFAICFRYLQYVRDQPSKDIPNRNSAPSARNSGISVGSSRVPVDNSSAESNFQPNSSDELPQYVYALAYHVIIFWFLALKLPDRAGQVTWITKNLVSIDSNGKEAIDEQAQVTLDFMQRVAYADVDESDPDPSFTKENFGEIQKKRWVIGNSLITIEQTTRGDWAQITKRQPSGTSCYIIQEKFSQPPAHQEQIQNDVMKDGRHNEENVKFPSHLLLQITAPIPQIGDAMRPVPLPNDDFMERFIKNFNRSFTVDGYKVGVIYIGEDQTDEVEILSNVQGSSDYTTFLSRLGTLTKLQGAPFNTQGLDRQANTDGEYTYCWRDRVTEIVFHVTTQMPTNLDMDPQCIGKKRHVGNDFVNIIFNNSGLPFRFETFPSEFNYVNIVITPESRESFVATRLRSQKQENKAFFKVQVMSKPGFPEISPAAETKIMSLEALPGFIRLLALNASVFALVWSNREGGQHVSSWRNRLHEINRVREKYSTKAPGSTPASLSPPGTSSGISNVRDSLSSLRRSSVANFNFLTNSSEPASQRSSLLSTAETEVGVSTGEGGLVENLDFSKWA